MTTLALCIRKNRKKVLILNTERFAKIRVLTYVLHEKKGEVKGQRRRINKS